MRAHNQFPNHEKKKKKKSLTMIHEDISDIFWAAGIFLCLDQLLPDSHHCSGSLDLK